MHAAGARRGHGPSRRGDKGGAAGARRPRGPKHSDLAAAAAPAAASATTPSPSPIDGPSPSPIDDPSPSPICSPSPSRSPGPHQVRAILEEFPAKRAGNVACSLCARPLLGLGLG